MTSVLQRLCSGEAPVSLGRELGLACGACWQAPVSLQLALRVPWTLLFCLTGSGHHTDFCPGGHWPGHWDNLICPRGQGGALQKLSPPFRNLKITASWVVSLPSSVS